MQKVVRSMAKGFPEESRRELRGVALKIPEPFPRQPDTHTIPHCNRRIRLIKADGRFPTNEYNVNFGSLPLYYIIIYDIIFI